MRFFNTIYFLLLIYIIAALVFWGLSLNRQSAIIYEQEMVHLRTQVDSVENEAYYRAQERDFQEKRERRKKQYIGEGTTFLLVIFIGAAVVYSSFQRSIRVSKQQNNFMLAVTHELKSPLAAMKLNLQTLEKYKLDEQKQAVLIEKCIKEANRLNELCNNMLLASQMEGRQYKATREKLNFTELLEQSLKIFTNSYPERIRLEYSGQDEQMVNGDRMMLQMSVNNLIENALKYSPPSSLVTIKLTNDHKQLCLQVLDQGEGIADAEKRKVFRKFYRVGNENTRKTKGTGLGLYLTKRIVEQHRGKIGIKNNSPNGSIFELYLPLA